MPDRNLILRDPVKAALALAASAPALDRNEVEGKISELQKKIDHLNAAKSRLLPVERSASDSLDREAQKLSIEQSALRKSLEIDSEKTYKHLSKEPLKWRKNGLPLLAIFNLDSSSFEICSENGVSPGEWKYSYQDVQQKLARKVLAWRIAGTLFLVGLYGGILSWLIKNAVASTAPDGWLVGSVTFGLLGACGLIASVMHNIWGIDYGDNQLGFFWRRRIRAEYSGVIPESTRKKISEAQTYFGKSNVHILAEVTKWSTMKEVAIRKADPLVVGVKHGTLWLVDAYDVTPLENYIKQEFTS